MTASAAMSSPTLRAAHASPNARRSATDGGSGTAAWRRWMRGSSSFPARRSASLLIPAEIALPSSTSWVRNDVRRASPSRSSRVVARRRWSTPAAVRTAAISASSFGSRTDRRCGLGGDLVVRRCQLREACLEDRDRLRGRSDLLETGEAERVVPRLAHRAGPGVLRPGRRAFAGEPVACIEPPQAAIAIDPAVAVSDEHRVPVDVAARPDDEAVAAGVVDEWDAEGPLRSAPRGRPGRAGRRVSRQTLRMRSSGPRMLRSPGNGSSMMYSPRSRYVACEPAPGIDDGMVVDGLEARVVPASAQVVALLVVGGRAEPGRQHRAVLELLEHDEALLEVRLVVVGAIERRPPVVHRVEEHVVQDHPAAFADDPAVVDDPGIASRISS